MSKKLLAVIGIIIVFAGFAIYKIQSHKVLGIAATGTIEITRADIAPKVSGYIGELSIKEGDSVTIGQVIAHISRPDLEAQKLRDEAALIKAELQLVDLKKGARLQELSEAQATVASGQAIYEKTQKDYIRQQELFQQGAISSQQLDAARSAYEVALSTLNAYQARANLVAEGNRPDAIATQQAEVERSQAIVKLAKIALDDTIVQSPLDGLVLSKNFEQGEYVNAGSSIGTVCNWRDCWVKVYVSSAQLGLIQVGQKVEIRVDSFPQREFNGEIKEISQQAEFTPRQSITAQERANMVFAVKVRIDNAEGILKAGMPVDVVIQ
ncbi:HlyD family secretion protein [Pelosinus sp. sgz500959]|uniref:HlyD family secretion protein n=1 Tax=Pelosinus sp. sgz500959 TaxID=3242472 RepID=UPI003672BF29